MGEAKIRKVLPAEIGAKAARNPKFGEEALSEIEALTLRLDSGKVVTFTIADQLRIPSNPVEIIKEAKQAPARLAFWRAQAARAAQRARDLERRYNYTVASYDLTHRVANNDADGEYTERLVRSQVDVTREVVQALQKLNRAKEQAELLKSVADAVEHRTYVLRTLVRREMKGGEDG